MNIITVEIYNASGFSRIIEGDADCVHNIVKSVTNHPANQNKSLMVRVL